MPSSPVPARRTPAPSTSSTRSPTSCTAAGVWFHVDAAYGGAALCLPECAALFRGVERADSIVIDPHKWLFSPLDCAALLYRRPALAARTHRQTAGYLEAFGDEHVNPSDLAFHLTRRTRGLPFWFTLVVHGTDAVAAAVRAGIDLARRAAEIVVSIGDPVRLIMEPQLSVVLFERPAGVATTGTAGRSRPSPTGWRSSPRRRGAGADVGRLVFLHPGTDMDAVHRLLQRLKE